MFTSPTAIPKCISIILIGALFAASTACAADKEAFWPQFHGPNRDNRSSEKGLLKKWPPQGPALLWTAKGLGHGYSTVSIAAGMIYTAGNIEKETVITALDLDGKILWQVKNGKGWTGDRPGTRGTPTIDGDRLYHESPHGDLICLQAKTGKKIWQVNILDKFKSKHPNWALAESLLIDGDHVICCPGGPQTCMVALHKDTGEVVWKAASANEPAGYASPIVVEHKGLRIIITLSLKGMIGVNADTGELLWHVKHVSYADENVFTPIYHDGQVFISSIRAGSVKWKINVKDGKALVEEIWRSKELDNHHGGGVLVDGYIYASSCTYNGSKWICLDWEAGEKKYAEKGVGKGSLTYADGLLYMLSENGVMGLVRPSPDSYGLISSFEIPKGGKGNSWAHPVVCGGRLYIRHGEFLYAYEVRSGGDQGSAKKDQRAGIANSTIRHLGHSAVLMKINDRVLVFDYPFGSRAFTDQIHMLSPSELKGEKVYVFASHQHGDHHNSGIFSWKDKIGHLRYVLSSDIKRHPEDAKIIAPGQVMEVDDIKVRAYPSTDSGVAYSVYVDGKHIYFAGDNGFWNWKGKRPEAEYISKDLALVDRAVPMDIAFQVCDPLADGVGDGGVGIFAVTFQPKLLVPIHLRGKYEFLKRIEIQLKQRGFKNRFWVVKDRDDSMSF